MKSFHIYIIGFPGSGKYTIAKNLCQLDTNFKLVDNHLINNPVFSLIEQDGKTPLPATVWKNVGKIWDIVLDTMLNISPPHFSFIMTNFLHTDNPEDEKWFDTVRDFAENKRQSIFIPVHIHCNLNENKNRIVGADRSARMKCIDPDLLEKWHSNSEIIAINHPNFLQLDVSDISPQDAAQIILTHAHKCT